MVKLQRWSRCIAASLVPWALAACQSLPESRGALLVAEVEMEQVQASAQKYQSGNSAVDQALLGGVRPLWTSAQPISETFDISVQDIDARSFFLSLVAGTGVNVVVHPEVVGKLSLDLNDVRIEDVLSVSRDIYGYEYKYNHGIYTIYPRKLRTQIFTIDYLDVQRVGVSDTSVLIGKIESQDSNNNSGGSSSSSGSEQMNLLALAGMGGDSEGGRQAGGMSPGARIQTLNKTDFWSSLQETILAMVGGTVDGNSVGDRMVIVNPQAGLVVVKALPHELNSVRDFLERAELSVKRQVILETKILEVQLNDQFEAGINWGEISGQLLLSKNVSTFGSPSDILTASEAVGEIFSSLIRVNDITRLLDLLETQGTVQVLSSPRVSTVNNQKAVIRVGTDEFFVTGLSSDTVSNASSTTSTPI